MAYKFLDFLPSLISAIPMPMITNITATVAAINEASTG